MQTKTVRTYLLLSALLNVGVGHIGALYVVFLAETGKGLNPLQWNFVNMAFWTTKLLMEVPTGILADRYWGRKKCVVLAFFGEGITFLLYSKAHTLLQYMAVEVLSATSMALLSGAFLAWFKDSLMSSGYTESITPFQCRKAALDQLGGIIGAFSGCMIALHGLHLAWQAGGLVILVTGVLAQLMMHEPKEHISQNKPRPANPWPSLTHPPVRFVLIIVFVQIVAVQAPNMQWHNYYKKWLTTAAPWIPNLLWLAIISACVSIALALGGVVAERYGNRKLSNQWGLLGSIFLVGFGIVVAGASRTVGSSLVWFMIHEFARGFYAPIKEAYLTDNLPSEDRATLLSYSTIPYHVGGIVGLLASGYIAKVYSIPNAWIASGIVLSVAALALAVPTYLRKRTR